MLGRRKRKNNRSENESLQLRKNLSLRLPFFPLNDLGITNHILRETFKYSFTKKIKRMTFEVDVFPYFAHHIPNALRQITINKLRFSSTKSSFRFNKKLAIRSIESQKSLKHLKFTSESVFLGQIKAARKLPSLEYFSCMISENEIPSLYKIFREPKHLHTVELMIQRNRDWVSPLMLKPEQINMTWILLKDLVKLKKLKTLRLNIEACAFTQDPSFFYRGLGVLGESQTIETLDLTLHLTNLQEEAELNEGAKKLLSKLQDLDIKSSKHYVVYVDFNEIKQSVKKIRISFLPNYLQDNIDISKLVAKCPALKTLVLEDDFGNLIVSPEIKLTANLELLKVCIDHKEDEKTQELLRYLSNRSQIQHILDFNMGLYHFTNQILEELIKINYLFSPSQMKKYSIFTQDVNHCDPNFDQPQRVNFFSSLPKSELFCQLFESISKLTSLTSLNIFTRLEEINTIESLANSLIPLQNLQHLKIQVYEKEKNPKSETLSIDMPVYNLKNLQSFSLKLSFNFRFRDFFGFLDKMAEIPKLEFFGLDCIDIDPRNEESIQRIAKTLDKFPSCKRIYVDRIGHDESLYISYIDAESKN